jgi:hypothetical protein
MGSLSTDLPYYVFFFKYQSTPSKIMIYSNLLERQLFKVDYIAAGGEVLECTSIQSFSIERTLSFPPLSASFDASPFNYGSIPRLSKD